MQRHELTFETSFLRLHALSFPFATQLSTPHMGRIILFFPLLLRVTETLRRIIIGTTGKGMQNIHRNGHV
jgi:hypothetical protein